MRGRFAVFLCSLFLFPLASRAVPLESERPLLNRTEHRLFDLLIKNLRFPKLPLPAGTATVFCQFEGATLRVLVVGPKDANAKTYAQVLDDWRKRNRLPGDTFYSQDEDGVAASYTYQPSLPFVTDFRSEHDLQQLADVSKTLEGQIFFEVSASAPTHIGGLDSPLYKSENGTRFWNFSDSTTRLPMVSNQTHIDVGQIIALLLWVSLVPVGFLCSWFGSLWATNDESVAIEQRRQRYGKILKGGVQGSLIAHALLTLVAFPSGFLDPICLLWFGLRFSKIAMSVIPAFFIVPLLIFPILRRREARLFAPTSAETQVRENKMTRSRFINKEGLSRRIGLVVTVNTLKFVCSILSVLFILAPGSPFDSGQNWRLLPFIFLCILSLIKIPTRTDPVNPTDPDFLSLEARLRDSVQWVSHQMGFRPMQSKVITDPISLIFAVQKQKDTVSVTPEVVELFSDTELKFSIAQVLAPERLKQINLNMAFLFLPLIVFVIFVISALSGRSPTLVTPGYTFSPLTFFLLGYFPISFLLPRFREQQMIRADALAVKITRDPAAAKSVLRKMAYRSDAPAIQEIDVTVSNPRLAARLAAIDRVQL